MRPVDTQQEVAFFDEFAEEHGDYDVLGSSRPADQRVPHFPA
jgi:hypothetical protein